MLENVIEAMVDAVVVIDVAGRISMANTATERITGYTREQLKALPVASLIVDDSSGMRTIVRRRIEDGNVLRRQESYLTTSAGERIPVSVTGSPVTDDTGKVLGIVLVARDTRELLRLLKERQAEIVRRTKAEDELRALNASIEKKLEDTRASLLLAERRATLGTLAGGVGHELGNIAQIQLGATEELDDALENDTDLSEAVGSVLPKLRRVGEHIKHHGQQLMRLARPGPDRVQPLDLNEVVRDVVAMLRGAGKLHRVECRTELSPEPLTVTVNRTRIEQILVNLTVNAADAIGDADGTITLAAHADGDRVACEVRDTGPGIEPDELEKIFERYFTTKGDHGTGLGLPVAREIVESYGGRLTVTSVRGKGTTFRFDLPR